MPINLGIYGNIEKPDVGNALQAYATGMQARGQQQQNRLAAMQMEAAQRQQQQQDALNNAYKGNIGPDGQVNYAGVQSALAGANAGAQIPGVAKAAAEGRNMKLDQAAKVLSLQKSQASQVMAAPTLANALASLDSMEAVTGKGSMDSERARLTAIGDNPEQIRTWAAGHALDARDLLTKYSVDDAGGSLLVNGINPVTGQTTQTGAIPKTMTLWQEAQIRQTAAGQAETERHNRASEKTAKDSAEAAPALTPDGIEAAADRYNMDGTLPPMGMGKGGATARSLILNRAAEKQKALGVSGVDSRVTQLSNKANTQALGQLQKQMAMISAFEDTANKNASIALEMSAKTDRGGSPLVNKWVMAGRKAITGDPDISRFNAANETFVNEYAKIMSGSMGNTAVTDSMRRHAHDMIGTAMNQEQYAGVISLLQREMKNRIDGLNTQRDNLTNSMRGGQPQAPQAASKPAAASIPARNAQGWVLHTDKNGNRAYVSPDGRQYQEVK